MLQLAMSIIIFVLRMKGLTSHPVVLGMTFLVMLFTLFAIQFLAWSFVYKLDKTRKGCAATKDRETDTKLMDVMKKHAVLSVVAVMSTTFYAIMVVVAVPLGEL